MKDEVVIRRVRTAGGVVRVRSLSRDGASVHTTRKLVADGRLWRPRKGWVAVPEADQLLVGAARIGGVITCVTQAKRMGCWTLDDDLVHVGVGAHRAVPHDPSARLHWCEPIIPRHPDALADEIENVLHIVSGCVPYEAALVVWESALRLGLVDLDVMNALPLRPRARRLLADALPFADSGLETMVIPRLRWLGLPLRRQVVIAGHRVDLLIGDRLVVQIDGGHHVGPQRDADIAHDARLKLMGYHVIRVSYHQIRNDWAAVHDVIVRAVAQRLHRAPAA